MVEIVDRITSDLKKAMLSRDTTSVDILKMLKTALQYEAIKSPDRELSEDQAITVLRKEAKKRREAQQLYSDSGSMDKSQKEQQEADFIEQYLPPVMSDEDIQKLVKDTISRLEANSLKDMGRVIAEVKEASSGRADGGVIARLVKSALGAER